MSEREEVAERVFVGLVQADGLDGGKEHLRDLAKLAFAAADVFIEVRDADTPDVFACSAQERR